MTASTTDPPIRRKKGFLELFPVSLEEIVQLPEPSLEAGSKMVISGSTCFAHCRTAFNASWSSYPAAGVR